MMNKLILAVISLFCSINVYSHINFENLSSTKNNELFIGMVNLIRFDESVSSVLINGVEVKPKNGLFELNVSSAGKVAVQLLGTKDKQIGELVFDVLRVPEMKIQLGTIKSGSSISKEDLLRERALIVQFPNCSLKHNFQVVSYRLIVKSKDGNAEEFAVESSDTFTSSVLASLKNTKSGDIIIIENIEVAGSDVSKRTLPDLKYTIL